MPRIKVPQKDGEIVIYTGHERAVYQVSSGEVTVDPGHVTSVLISIADSELLPEAPASKKEK